MITYEIVDDAITLTYTLGVTATVTLAVTKPDGTVSNPTPTESPTGVYTAVLLLDQAGTWLYKFTVGQLKARFGISDSIDDDLIRHTIRSASRAIDDECGRRFYLDIAATARQYRTASAFWESDGEVLLIDDIGNLTGVVVEVGDGTTWTAVTNYATEPFNAIVQGRPVRKLRRTMNNWSTSRQVRVTARWGWPNIPGPIRDATEILAGRLFKRKDAPFGVAGFGEFGDIRILRTDPDVERDIAPYRLTGFA